MHNGSAPRARAKYSYFYISIAHRSAATRSGQNDFHRSIGIRGLVMYCCRQNFVLRPPHFQQINTRSLRRKYLPHPPILPNQH